MELKFMAVSRFIEGSQKQYVKRKIYELVTMFHSDEVSGLFCRVSSWFWHDNKFAR